MTTAMRTGLYVAVLVIGGIVGLSCGGDHNYQLKNARVFESVPVYPGARHVGTKTAAIRPAECNSSCEPIGDSASVAYKISDDISSRDIIDFFVRELGGAWELQVEEVGVVFTSTASATFQGAPPDSSTGDFVTTFARGSTRILIGTRAASAASRRTAVHRANGE